MTKKPDKLVAMIDSRQFIGQKFTREFRIGEVDKENRSIELSFSSDIELERFPGMVEVLSHDRGAVDLSRLNDSANLLFNHNMDFVVGVVESARIADGSKGRAVVRFGNSARAQEIWEDVQDGILRNISVGYRINDIKLDEERDGVDVYRVTNWQPYEISIVSVPADSTVGVGRSQESNFNKINKSEERKMADEVEKPEIDVGAERDQARDSERDRVRTILETGRQYRQVELANEYAADGRSVIEFNEALLKRMKDRVEELKESQKPLGLSDKEVRQYSLVKLLRSMSDPENAKARKDAAFEYEISQAAIDKMHRDAKGVVIPIDVLNQPLMQRGSDTVSIISGTGYAGTGANVIEDKLLSSSFIDLLRNKSTIMKLGTKLSGLVGNLDIPKKLSGTSTAWLGEDDPAPRSDVTFGQISLSPKTISGLAEITRRMLMQPSLDVEALVRADLAEEIALAIDSAGYYGDGTGNQPIGILNTAGVNAVTFASSGSPIFSEMVKLETEIASDNADVSSMAYVTNAAMRGYFKTTEKFSGTSGATIWEPGNTINGYSTEITNQINAGEIFFGNFKDLLIGLWGGLEITVDPFTHSDRGRLRLVFMQDLDFEVRRPESFALGA